MLYNIISSYDQVQKSTEISGSITSPDSTHKTLLFYKRSDGSLLGAVTWNSITSDYMILLPNQGAYNVMLLARDEGGNYNSDSYDRLSQGVHTYVPDEFSDAIIQPPYGLINKICVLSKNVVLYSDCILTYENIKGNIDNILLIAGGYTASVRDSGNNVLQLSQPGIINGIRVIRVGGNFINLEYGGNELLKMSSDPFSDGSQVAGYALNGNGININGSGDIDILACKFVNISGSWYSGMGFRYVTDLRESPLMIRTGYRISSNSSFSISFKFIMSVLTQYSSCIWQHDAFALYVGASSTFGLFTCNNGTWSSVQTASGSLTSNIVYTVVLTYNSSTNTVKIYLNGTLVGTFTSVTISPNDTSSRICFNNFQKDTSYSVHNKAFLSNIRVFNKELSLAEAQSLQVDTPVVGSTVVSTIYQSEILNNKLKLAAPNKLTAPVHRFRLNGFIGDEFSSSVIPKMHNTFPGGVHVPPDLVQFDGVGGSLWRGDSKTTETNANVVDESDLSVYVRFMLTTMKFDFSLQSTLSNNGLTVTANQSGGDALARSVFSVSSGKVYWEIRIDSASSNRQIWVGAISKDSFGADYPGSVACGTNSWSYYGYNGNKFTNSGVGTAYGSTFTTGDVVGIALDMTNGRIFFSKNNVWQNSGDPVAGTGYAYNGITGEISPAVSFYVVGDCITARFVASSQSYTAPTGYTAIGDVLNNKIKCLWKSGNTTNGFGVGINTSGNLLVSALNGGAQTSGTCSGSSMTIGTWYKLYATPVRIALYSDSDSLISETTGLTLSAGNSTGKESVGASILGSVLSLTSGDSEYFQGKISDIIVTKYSDSSELLNYKFGANRDGVCIFKYLPYHSFGKGKSAYDNEALIVSGTNTKSHHIELSQGFDKSVYWSNFTFTCTFLATTLDSTARAVFGMYLSNEFGVYVLSVGNMYVVFNGTTTNISFPSVHGLSSRINNFYRIVVINDVTNNTLKMYINKTLVYSSTSVTVTHYTVNNGSGQTFIGSSGGSTYNFAGAIQDIQIFDYAVTEDQIPYILSQNQFNALTGIHSTTIFDPYNSLAEILKGEALNSISITDTQDSAKVAYSLTFDRLTYKHYVSSAWVSIASKDPSVHGNGGDNRWYYLNASAVWVLSNDTANDAISKALAVSSNYMNSTNLQALNTANFTAGGYSSVTGVIAVAITLNSDSASKNPTVEKVAFNNKHTKLTEVFPLDAYTGIITTSSIEISPVISQSGIDLLSAMKAYVFITGQSNWVEYTQGSTIPGITAGMNTVGKSLQVKLVLDLSTGMVPVDTSIKVIIK